MADPSKREQILDALLTTVLAPAAATLDRAPMVQRNGEMPKAVGSDGMVVLRDGSGELEEYVIGAPEPYAWAYAPKLEVMVQDAGPDLRDPQFDAICAAIGDVLLANRTLGGLCDWIDMVLPDTTELAIANAPGIKGAIIPLSISYASASPAG